MITILKPNRCAALAALGLLLSFSLWAASPEGSVNVTSVDPHFGPTAGGTGVSIGGTGFVAGAVVSFGGGAATGVTVVSGALITCTTPPHSAGAVDVTVTNVDLTTGTLTSGFTYTDAAAPTVTGVSPNSGPVTGGTPVTVTGTGFVSGVGLSVTFGGSAATGVTWNSATSLSCTTPNHAAGAVDVRVTNPDGQFGTLAGGFTYTGTQPAPTVTGVNPASGPSLGGQSITVTGTNFVSGTGLAVRLGGTDCTGVVFVSGTTLQAGTAAHAPGVVNVVVQNPDGQMGTLAGGYTYTGSPAPSITGINPPSGTTLGGTLVGISGLNFVAGAKVFFGASEATSVNVVTASAITCNSPAHAAGVVDVTVTNPDTQSDTLPGAFTYLLGPAPTVTAVNPTSGPIAGGTDVTVTGTNFAGGAAVTFGGSPAASVVVVSSTSITCVTPAHAVGKVDVVVRNADAQTGTLVGGFEYVTAGSGPTVTKVEPNVGPTAGGTTVTITGTNFTGVTAVNFGTIAATSFAFVSATQITAVSPAQAAGIVHVTVTTPSGTSPTGTADQFTYQARPVVTNLNPNLGPSGGGTAVTITGTGFTGATAVLFGTVPAASFSVGGATQISATSPAQPSGAVHVTVTTPYGTSITTEADVFTYQPCTLTCDATVPSTGQVGTAVSFAATATATSCTGTVTYVWTFGDGETSTQQNPSHTYASPGNFSWSMTASVGSTICQKYGAITVVTPPLITRVKKLTNPFRLRVDGANFHQNCTILINDVPVPETKWKSLAKVIAKKGDALKAMVPAGQTVQVRVRNNDDGGLSAPFSYTR